MKKNSEDDEDVRPNKFGDLLGDQDILLKETQDDTGLTSDKMKNNYLDLTQTAGASLKYGVSSTATAGICSGFLADQIKGKILPPAKMYLAVDKSKVARRVCHENKKSLLIYGHP